MPDLLQARATKVAEAGGPKRLQRTRAVAPVASKATSDPPEIGLRGIAEFEVLLEELHRIPAYRAIFPSPLHMAVRMIRFALENPLVDRDAVAAVAAARAADDSSQKGVKVWK